jgi:pilus assembly protein Flp/PilA
MIKKIMDFFKDEQGATAVEYGLMVALIAVAIIATVGLLGDQLNATFNQVRTEMAAAS